MTVTHVRDRMDILNFLTLVRKYERYLEIGVQYAYAYTRVKCQHKEGVEPDRKFACTHSMTSDKYFETLDASVKFDLILVDGLHVAEQAKRDICNSLSHLSEGGAIVVHDCNPQGENFQRVPRPKGQKCWNGDTWRAFVQFKRENPLLTTFVVDVDHGCGVIEHPGDIEVVRRPFDDDKELSWDNFVTHRDEWTDPVGPYDFVSRIYAQAHDGEDQNKDDNKPETVQDA